MDTLDQYRVFVQVAEMGSFIRAAHALELPGAERAQHHRADDRQ